MLIPDRELAGTIRFAMKATKELSLSDFHSQATAVQKLGVELGHDVAKTLTSKKNKDLYVLLAAFWNESGLGKMEVVQSDPKVIRLHHCYDCGTAKVGNLCVPCSFKRSLLETILQDALGTTVRVDELECCKSGGEGCVFRLRQS